MARHSFQPQTSIFPRFVLYFPILRTLLQEISPFIIATLLFLHSENTFPIRFFPFFILYPTFLFSIDFLSALHSPTLFTHSPTFFLIPPHFSISLPNLPHERAHPRALRAYAYARTYSHVRRFSFIAFTASPTPRNPLGTNTLGVKKNKKSLHQKAQSPHNQHINAKHPISSTVNFISSPR